MEHSDSKFKIPSTPWTIVPSIWTFSMLSANSPLHALLLAVASILAFNHVVHVLPQSAKFRSMLWAFGNIPVVVFLAREAMVFQAAVVYRSYSLSGVEHPIEHLAREAHSRFTRVLENQSKTYNEAYTNYVRRYSMTPPPGFDQWFEFATNHES